MQSPRNPVVRGSRRASLVVAALLAAPLAWAQTAPAAPAASGNEPPPITLDKFNVSATKVQSYQADSVQMGAFRDVNPTDVPLTINVLTREVLDAQAARGLHDALKNTAGVTRSQISAAAYDNLAIRGILVENRGNYRLNGSLPIINLADTTMENKERVEVLKGTSSLYYGFIPPSGVINMVTKRPLPTPLTTITASANIHGGYGGAFDISRSYGFGQDRSVGIRLNGSSGREEQGIERYDGHREFISAAVDVKLSSRFAIRGDWEYLVKDVVETPAILLPTVNSVLVIPARPSNKTSLGGDWQRYDAWMQNWWMRADFIINPNWTIYAETGRAHTRRDRIFSQFIFAAPQATTFTTGAGNVQVGFFPNQNYENENYRVELFGRFHTGSVRHDLSVGWTTNTREQNSRSQGANVNVPQNYYNPVPLPRANPTSATINQVPSEIEDTGLYVSDRLSAFDERLQVIGGVRYTDYRSTTTTSNYVIDGETNPLFAVVWKPTAKSSVYASYLKGLEAGQTAGAAQANAGFVLPPLTSEQYEIGAKAQFFEGVLVQLGFFEIERPSAFVNAQNFLTANGLTKYRGVELFASGEITKQLSLVVSGSILDAENLNAANATTYQKTPNGLAKFTGSAFAEWRTPVKGLAVSFGAYHTGKRWVNDRNDIQVPGFTTASLGASYQFKLGEASYTLRVNGDNVFDTNAWDAVGASGTSSLLGVTRPRNFKFSLTASF